MGKKEQIIVKRAFNSNWITTKGPQLDSFEKKISNYINIKNVAAVSSGTAAIHLALILLGIFALIPAFYNRYKKKNPK